MLLLNFPLAGALLYWRYEDAAVERFDEYQRDLTWLTAIILGANFIMAVIFFFLIVSCACWLFRQSRVCAVAWILRLRQPCPFLMSCSVCPVPPSPAGMPLNPFAFAQLAFLHAPLMGKLKVLAKRWCAKKPKQRRARHGRVTDPNKPVDENDSEEDDSDDSDYKLKFEDNYETDQAWNVKNAEGLSKFTSMNPLAAATAADPRAARKQKQGDDGTHAARLNPALGQRLFKDQEAIAELSAQHMEQTTKASASAKEEANRPAPAALLVSRAYAGKGATKH